MEGNYLGQDIHPITQTGPNCITDTVEKTKEHLSSQKGPSLPLTGYSTDLAFSFFLLSPRVSYCTTYMGRYMLGKALKICKKRNFRVLSLSVLALYVRLVQFRHVRYCSAYTVCSPVISSYTIGSLHYCISLIRAIQILFC